MATWAERAAGARDYADMLALALEIRASENATAEQRLLAERVVNSVRSYIRSQTTTREQTARVRFWKLLDALHATN
jgi:negative regulator of replication initiation